MITVSENAQKQVVKLIQSEGYSPDSFIRVGVKTGGCSGLSYELKFDTEYELKNGKQQPYVKNQDPEFEKIKNENIKKKLEHNMKILEALEQEQLEEQKQREA